MDTHPGRELTPRRAPAALLAVTAVLLVLPTARAASRAAAETGPVGTFLGWLVAGVLALLLVGVPLWAALLLASVRYRVSHDAVTRLRVRDARQSVRFADVSGARVSAYGRSDSRLPLEWVWQVTLYVPAHDGRHENLHVSGLTVADLRPLLDRLAEEAQERPGILDDSSRTSLGEALSRPGGA